MSIVTPMPTAVRDQASLAALDRAHYMHGYHLFDEHRQQDALQIGGGDGAYIQDLAGNRYLDAVGGMWCTNIGLGREEMVEAIAAQTRQLAYANPFCDMANPRAVELCAKLAEHAEPGRDCVRGSGKPPPLWSELSLKFDNINMQDTTINSSTLSKWHVHAT